MPDPTNGHDRPIILDAAVSDPVLWARSNEGKARQMLTEAALDPGYNPCDDAFMVAAVFGTLLDDARKRLGMRVCDHMIPFGECHVVGCRGAIKGIQTVIVHDDGTTTDQMKLGWTQPICVVDWANLHPDRQPVRVVDADPETCCMCGLRTDAGIYMRVDPREVPFPSAER